MKIRLNSNSGCYTLTVFATFYVLGSFLMALWTDRTLDFWCSYFAHHTVDIPLWASWLVSFVLSAAIIAVNLISEIIRFCM